MLINICKTILLVVIAVFFTVVAFNNIADYGTNYLFVQHVLNMDTILPHSKTTWHALTSPALHTLFYGFIIVWQSIIAIVCWIATVKLFVARHDVNQFKKAKAIAILGLTLGFVLYAFGFIVIGGEWFQMWQSQIWNGQRSASIFMTMIGVVMLILLTGE